MKTKLILIVVITLVGIGLLTAFKTENKDVLIVRSYESGTDFQIYVYKGEQVEHFEILFNKKEGINNYLKRYWDAVNKNFIKEGYELESTTSLNNNSNVAVREYYYVK